MTKTIEDYSLAEVMQKIKEVMQKIEEVLNQNPEPIQGLNVIYQYNINGEEEGTYQLQLQDGKASVTEGAKTQADCTLNLSLENFRKFLLGKLNGTVAFMTGNLKISGDMGKAIKMEGILRQYNIKDHL